MTTTRGEHATASATYFPLARAIYAGIYTNISEAYKRNYLATLMPDLAAANIGKKLGMTLDRTASDADVTTGPIPRIFERLDDRFANTYSVVTKLAALHKLYKAGGITPLQLAKLEQLERTADVNDGNIFQITIVQFIDSILGEIENDVVVTRAPFHIPLNGLRGKIPEGGWFGVDMQVDRMNEPRIFQNEFGQAEVRIKRNDIHMYMSREDRMEATIDPYAWNLMQAQQNRIQARDLQALVALSEMKTYFGSVSGGAAALGAGYNSEHNATVIKDPTANASNVVPRAENDTGAELLAIIKAHFQKFRNRPTKIVLGVDTFRACETNWFLNKGKQPPSAGQSGIVDFPGLEKLGIKAYISWWCPEGVMYMLGRRGFYEFDGPMSVDASYDQRRHADFTSMRDFIGYFLMNPQRYCEKVVVPIAGQNTVAAGSGAGGIAEIDTFEKVEEMLAPPDDTGLILVQKNDNA